MYQTRVQKKLTSRATLMVALGLSFLFSSPVASLAAVESEPLAICPSWGDAGEMMAGSTKDLQFVISNTGEKEVRLIYIFAECDCTLNIPDSATVPAGGKFILRAELSAKDTGPGRLEEQITILTDHPVQNELKIPVSAWITETGKAKNRVKQEEDGI